MKQKVIGIFILLSSISMASVAQNKDSMVAAYKAKEKADLAARLSPGCAMPQGFYQIDSNTRFNSNAIPNDKNVVMMIFNPLCGHCQEEGMAIMQSLAAFPNTQFLFVTSDQRAEDIPAFKKAINYVPNKQVLILSDVNYVTSNYFAYNGLPQVMVYGKDKKLIDVYYKEIPIQNIKNSLQKTGNVVIMDADTTVKPIKKKKKRFLKF
jgi:thiol-disulfide isomerase/thioredoxin